MHCEMGCGGLSETFFRYAKRFYTLYNQQITFFYNLWKNQINKLNY